MLPKCTSDVEMQRYSPWHIFPFPLNATDKKLDILPRPGLEGSDGSSDASRWPNIEEVTKEGEASPAPGTPKFTPQDEGGSNNILAYVSVLAAVVLGLLLYVAYKWWVVTLRGVLSCSVDVIMITRCG